LETEEQFSAGSNGEFKEVQALKQKYQDLKKNTKQTFSANRRNFMQTGGGSCELVEIDDADEFIKDLLGDQIEGQPSLCDSDVYLISKQIFFFC
jgi:hypothetical protein